MEDKFTVEKCRQILDNAAIGMTDKEIEELRDFYIAFSDYIIDSRIERLKLNKIEIQYENKKASA
jgi:hypothetical protein